MYSKLVLGTIFSLRRSHQHREQCIGVFYPVKDNRSNAKLFGSFLMLEQKE